MLVFMSYASLDRATAEAVQTALEAAGLEIWRDRTRLETDWSREIAQAVSQAQALCLLWSAGAAASKWVLHEWLTARALGIPIVVVTLPGSPPNPAPLRNLDNVALPGAAGYGSLAARLCSAAPPHYDYSELPAHSYLPFNPNPGFVGRRGALVEAYLGLIGNLQRIGTRHAGFTGLGGIGKTQLLVEVAHRFAFAFEGVYWIDGDHELGWLEQLVVLARDYLDLSGPDGARPDTPARYLAALHRFARDHPSFLLVVDNVADPRELNSTARLVVPLLALGFSVLYSSRSRHVPPGVTAIEVAPLAEAEAIAVLTAGRKPGSPQDHQAVAQIAAGLGYLPLALILAAGFLAKYTTVSFAQYAGELARDALPTIDAAELTAEELATRHEAAVTVTLNSQWAALQDERARHVFMLAARFASGTDVPKARLVLFAGRTELKSAIDRPWDRAIALLENLHLAEPVLSGQAIRLHPLVRSYGRSLAPDAAPALERAAALAASQAYAQVATLLEQHQQRGVDAVLADLEHAFDWTSGQGEAARELAPLIQVVARERHHLRPGVRALQQLQFRAALLRSHELALRFAAALAAEGAFAFQLVFASQVADQAVVRTYLNPEPDSFDGSIVRVSPDGSHVVTSNWHGLTVWNLASGATRQLKGHETYVQDLVISGDDEVVSVDDDGVLLRWQLTDGEPVERVRLAERCAQDAAEGLELRCSSLSRSGREVLMVWDNRERFDWNTPREQHLTVVLLADLDDGSVRHLFQFAGHCNRCARSSDDRFAAVGNNSEPMWVLLDLAQGGAARIFSGSIESTYKVKGIGEMAFDAKGRTLASIVNEDIALWDIASGRIVTLFRGHDPGPSDLCFNADGRLLISAGRDAVRTWNLAALQPEASFRGHPGGANGVAVLPGTRLVVSAGDGRLVVWDLDELADGGEEGHVEGVAGLAASADGARIASAADDGVLVWDRDDGFAPRRLELPFELPEDIVLDKDGGFIADGDDDPLSVTYRNDTRPIALSPDGQTLFIAGSAGEVHQIDLATGAHRATPLTTSPLRELAVLPDGRALFCADYTYAAFIWDLESGATVAEYKSDRDWLITACLSPNGRVAVTGGENSRCRLDFEQNTAIEGFQATGPRRDLRGDANPEYGVVVFPSVKGKLGTMVNAIALNEDGSRALVAFADDQPVLEAYPSGEQQPLDHQQHAVSATALTEDGTLGVTATSSGMLCAWDAEAAGFLGLVQTESAISRLLVRGNQLVVGDASGRLMVFALS